MTTGVHVSAERTRDARDLSPYLFREGPFVPGPPGDPRTCRVRLVDESWEAPCRLDGCCVRISTANSGALSRYCRAPKGLYLAMLTALGLVQACALRRNPLLVPEDLAHRQPGCCLFAACGSFDTLIPALDAPRICDASAAFYQALLVGPEVERLVALAAAVGEHALR